MNSPATSGTPPRVLVQMPNWLGDVIMTTPLISFLDAAFKTLPEKERPELHLAVRGPWSALFADDPRVSDMLIIDRDGLHAGVAGIWRQAKLMSEKRYAAVVECPPSLRAGLAAALARIPVRIGHATDGRGLLLSPGLARGPRGSRHYSFEMLELGLALLESLQIEAPELPAVGLPLPALHLVEGGSAREDEAGTAPLWIIAPGTTYGEAKTWPRQRLGEFVEKAVEQEGVRVVLLGDAQTADFVAAMRSESRLSWTNTLRDKGQVVDLTGQTNLQDVVQIMREASAFVGNDSGLMHLAGAVGLPAVGIFGSSNPDWTHPLGRRTAAVVADGFECRPCYRKTCNQSRFCLAEIPADLVLDRMRTLLADPAAESEDC